MVLGNLSFFSPHTIMDIFSDAHCGFWINCVRPLKCLLNSTVFEGLLNPNGLKSGQSVYSCPWLKDILLRSDQLSGWLTYTQKKTF